MNDKKFSKLLKKQKFNSGFTLTELLVGLIMGTIVVGAMGFGLSQVLSITQSETSRSAARNEISRAIDFISDELRRAQSIEVDTSIANLTTADDVSTPDIDESIAPSYTLPTGGRAVLALRIPGVSERVIYSVAPPQSDKWRAPLVIYRWGPGLQADGSYIPVTPAGATPDSDSPRVDNPTKWQNLALIDGLDGTPLSLDCDNNSVNETYDPGGFHACITGTNTAQLFFSGQTATVTGAGASNYSADTKAVTRANTAPINDTDFFASYVWSFKDLGGAYQCDNTSDWNMRTDFSTDSNTDTWTRNTNRQPQPIAIDSSKPLTITSNPIDAVDCLSSNVPVDHEIDFSDPRTFNGNIVDANGDIIDSENKSAVLTDHDNDDNTALVETQAVQFIKKGGDIPNHGGFDANKDGVITISDTSKDQPSLGRFLYEKGYAQLVSGSIDDSAAQFKVIENLPDGYNPDSPPAGYPKDAKVLGDDERIIAFEVGQTDTSKAGFDLQDNIFIVASDVFKKKFQCSGSCSEYSE